MQASGRAFHLPRPLLALCALLTLVCAPLQAQDAPRVRVDTNLGSFVIELAPQRAPLTVATFLDYVRQGHYTDTLFHRVVSNFVIQGGGYGLDKVEKPTGTRVPNEAGNGLSNIRGSVGVARTDDPHDGSAQFYINIADNQRLDPQPSRWGYAVFGQVVEGMRVVDEIGAVATGSDEVFDSEVPLRPVVIERIELL